MNFCFSIWKVGYLGGVRLLESMQRRLMRRLFDFGHLSCVERLKKLGLFPVDGRLVRANAQSVKMPKTWPTSNYCYFQ